MFAALGGMRSVGYLIASLAVVAALWWVSSRIGRSYTAEAEAAQLEKELNQKKLDIHSLRVSIRLHEQEKASLAALLLSNQEILDRNIQKAIGRVQVISKPNPACDLNIDIIGVLNAARRNGALPSTPVNPASPSG